MLRAHRQAWCWQDEYYGLTIDDIRELERQTQAALQEKMAQALAEENGEVRPSSVTSSPSKDQVTIVTMCTSSVGRKTQTNPCCQCQINSMTFFKSLVNAFVVSGSLRICEKLRVIFTILEYLAFCCVDTLQVPLPAIEGDISSNGNVVSDKSPRSNSPYRYFAFYPS